jgi:hypothetical protein
VITLQHVFRILWHLLYTSGFTTSLYRCSKLRHVPCMHKKADEMFRLTQLRFPQEPTLSPTGLRTSQYCACTRCDNVIPGMAAACRWGVESGKLMYPRTSGHVPTCVYMSHRPNEPFVPQQQRKQYVSVVYCCVGGNMSDKNWSSG